MKLTQEEVIALRIALNKILAARAAGTITARVCRYK